MLEPSPELSSDLEWMLQSSQVDEETLIDALIHEYGDPTFRIALAFLGDAEAARQALVQVLSAALLNAYRYRNKQEVQTALETLQAYERQSKRYQQPDEAQTMDRPSLPSEGQNVDPAPVQIAVWRSLDSLPANVRLLLVLQFVSGWSIAMIAATLMLSQQKVAENMSRGLRSIRTNLGSQMLDEASLRGGDLEENLVRLVEVRWPEYADLLPDWGYVRTKALEQARHRSAARRRFNALKESLLIGIAALIFIGLVWGANRFLPEPEQAQTPPRALGANRAQKPGPTRPAATRTPRPSPTPTRSFYKRPFPMGAYYYAIPGDTLEMVAARYGTTASELARLNHLLPSQPLEIGQPLLIPGRFTPGTQPTFTPVPDVELPEPLDASASRQDIENRLSTLGDGQNYHTIWIISGRSVVDHAGSRGWARSVLDGRRTSPGSAARSRPDRTGILSLRPARTEATLVHELYRPDPQRASYLFAFLHGLEFSRTLRPAE
jgi:DNA-directed RNA polymerase specialized sigma24 family protein/LysM repeat protein